MYQFRDKKKYRRRMSFVRALILGLVILLLFVLGIVSWSGNVFHFIGKPFWKAEKAITDKISLSSYLVRTKASVFNENESLKNKITELEIIMTDYQFLKSENEQLKSLLGRLPEKHNFILGNVIVKPNYSPYDTLIIDIGQKDNIMEGEQVFANAEVPIGTISKVYENTSLVTLYSSPNEKTEAMINGSNATVELVGRGGGNFEMTVPIDLVAEKGTVVTIPNIESRIIAIIESTLSNQTDSVKKVLLSSPVNIFELKWVQVKKN